MQNIDNDKIASLKKDIQKIVRTIVSILPI